MKFQKTLFGCLVGVALSMNVNAQEVQGFVHERSTDYEWPTDQQVLDKLDKWQDQKFGVLFHWGLYSVPGIVESWSICSEDVDWISRKKDMTYDEYKKWYWGLKESLNPTQFNPDKWADIMKDAGMKYMIFTTIGKFLVIFPPVRMTVYLIILAAVGSCKIRIPKPFAMPVRFGEITPDHEILLTECVKDITGYIFFGVIGKRTVCNRKICIF
mgnify:CR=1 FL=1